MLTDTAIRAAKPKEKPYKLSDNDGNMVEVKRNVADSLEALSCDFEVNLPPAGWQRQPDIVFQQRDPLPFTVLAVIPKIAVAG